MGCFRGRKDDDLADVRAEQKWDYINLRDFKSTSCWTPFSYVLLYFSVIISAAVYGVDTFTAINLLVFSRWASQIKPEIPFYISKWIFAGCIILSFVLLIYRWLRAIRVIKSGGIAPCYLDPIAVRVQSIRMGEKGQGWRRFLVFADLTKSKKGADYVALFTHFNFEAWLRLLFADGPRQVINGITLYEVLQLRLIPQGENAPEGETSDVQQFFMNIEALADDNKQQAVILFAMLFTFVIFVISILSLLVSILMYLLFLWHHIPSEDGSLTAYCRRKINTRLERIVKQRVDKALAKGVALQDRKREDVEAGIGPVKRQPTLPTLGDSSSEQSMPPLPKDPLGLSRQTTGTTLPPYSRPSTSNTDRKGGFSRQPTLPDTNWDDKRQMGSSTPFSRTSDDNAPLVSNASGIGYGRPGDYEPGPPPSLHTVERHGTPASLRSGPRPPTSQDRRTPGPNANRGDGYTPGNGFPLPSLPPAADRRTPASSVTNRSATPGSVNGPSSPQNPGAYRAFTPGNNFNGARGPSPSPSQNSTTAPPSAYRNFTRPYLNSPSNEQYRSTPPPRAGTASPRHQHQPPPNQF